jgi:hypothetical protein
MLFKTVCRFLFTFIAFGAVGGFAVDVTKDAKGNWVITDANKNRALIGVNGTLLVLEVQIEKGALFEMKPMQSGLWLFSGQTLKGPLSGTLMEVGDLIVFHGLQRGRAADFEVSLQKQSIKRIVNENTEEKASVFEGRALKISASLDEIVDYIALQTGISYKEVMAMVLAGLSIQFAS